MKNTRTSISIVVALLTATSTGSLPAQVHNGDYSSGLSGWTFFLPPNNSLSPDTEVAPIDIDGTGPLGQSAAFHVGVGQGSLLDLQQGILLSGGLVYNFNADLAMTPPGNNGDGGTISVLIGPTQIASYSFGETTYGVTEYATLSGTYQPTSSGTYTLSINFSRGYGLGPGWAATPSDWIDNVQLTPVPEPSSAAIVLGACVLWTFLCKRIGSSRRHDRSPSQF